MPCFLTNAFVFSKVQEEVFSYINKKKMYAEVATSGYFQKFVTYLASTNQLNDLIMETITSGRWVLLVFLNLLISKVFILYCLHQACIAYLKVSYNFAHRQRSHTGSGAYIRIKAPWPFSRPCFPNIRFFF